jgi:putative addiction module component (TIGR02574 family)
MSMNHLPELLKLSVAERIQLVEDIWDSIAAEASAVELSDEIREELDRRLDDQEANPGIGHSWPEVKERLLTTARDADITARLNSVYGEEPAGLSPGLRQAQAASVPKVDCRREDAALVRAIQEGEATELVSRDEVMRALQERARRGSRERYEAALAEVPDVEPEKYDRL